jgi:uncharacterized repeat protein (TIGR03803 family)
MKLSIFYRHVVGIFGAIEMLAGCDGSQSMPGSNPRVAFSGGSASYGVLFSFEPRDGTHPDASLTELGGRLYGTTYRGGRLGNGTVFSLSAAGRQRVLYRFQSGSDGAHPDSALVDLNGTLYGTTITGGTGSFGTVFSMTVDGKERVLYGFSGGSDGSFPNGLTAMNGTLYGTTFTGGTSNAGTVFSVTTSGAKRVLYNFTGARDGANPRGNLAVLGGTLYGTTTDGGLNAGSSGYGTIFKVTAAGKLRNLYRFKGGSDGANPYAGMTVLDGTLYGTTDYGGGNSDSGTCFSLSAAGKERVLYRFKGGSDGAKPFAGLINLNGTLYGTTESGGTSGDGTVFSVSVAGNEQVLYAFKGAPDGAVPTAALTGMNGTLYGTTLGGGSHGAGLGTVFALGPK